MQEQLDAYKTAQEPNAESFNYICEALRQLALEAKGIAPQAAAPVVALADVAAPAAPASSGLRLQLINLKEKEPDLLLEELGNLGTLTDVVKGASSLEATIDGVGKDDIVAVLCFVIDEAQIQFPQDAAPAAVAAAPVAEAEAEAPVQQTATVTDITPAVKREQACCRRQKQRIQQYSRGGGKVDQLINRSASW